MTEWMNESVEKSQHGENVSPLLSRSNSTSSTTGIQNLDSGSAKKRWLRQAISEEIDPIVLNQPSVSNSPPPMTSNSRPDSPQLGSAADHIGPLKKRRLARASMSSEVSNTPPSTPNNVDTTIELDSESETTPDKTPEQTLPEKPVVEKEEKVAASEEAVVPEQTEDMKVDVVVAASSGTKESNPNPVSVLATNQKIVVDVRPSKDDSTKSKALSPVKRTRWDKVDPKEPPLLPGVASTLKDEDKKAFSDELELCNSKGSFSALFQNRQCESSVSAGSSIFKNQEEKECKNEAGPFAVDQDSCFSSSSSEAPEASSATSQNKCATPTKRKVRFILF